MAVVGFVPARGGSRRIPRKNLRTVQGVPLIVRTIRTLRAAGIERVVCSTDDQEIAAVASLADAEIDFRPPALAEAGIPLDVVIAEWASRQDPEWDGVIVVAQPTSPFLSPFTVMNAIERCVETGETVMTVTPERHLLWSPDSTPMYSERRNSDAPGDADYFRETGGCVAALLQSIDGEGWPPAPVTLLEIEDVEGIDIDEYSDLVRARAGARPSSIQIRYIEGTQIGSGHRRRAEALAIELAGHHQVVVSEASAPLMDPAPEVVVLDTLDTTAEQVMALRRAGVRFVVSLEDLGTGADNCDLVVNELYDTSYGRIEITAMGEAEPRYIGSIGYGGPKYAVLRPEFQGHPFQRPRAGGDAGLFTILVSFGGTDPSDLTHQTVEALAHFKNWVSAKGKTAPKLRLRVVVPPQRPDWHLATDQQIEIISRPVMAREFLEADLAILSAGRTVHEAAACSCPIISIAANAREENHDVCPGVSYLLPRNTSFAAQLLDTLEGLLANPLGRQERAKAAYDAVDGLGAQRIAWLIDGLVGGML